MKYLLPLLLLAACAEKPGPAYKQARMYANYFGGPGAFLYCEEFEDDRCSYDKVVKCFFHAEGHRFRIDCDKFGCSGIEDMPISVEAE